MALNQSQKEAIGHGEGPCLVLAGPGSGKTTVIVHRIDHLIRKEGVKPDDILVVTFTKNSAREMKERCRTYMKRDPGVTFGTFHGIFFSILRRAYGFHGSSLMTREKKYQFLYEASRNILFSKLTQEDMEEALTELSGEIERWKNQGKGMRDFDSGLWRREDFQQVVEAYEARKREARVLDFEDMLLQCRTLFEEKPEVLKRWQMRYPHMMVDEFQDINPVQYDVMKMLANRSGNIFVVGDDDQSVYGFRGADPNLMKQFTKDFPGVKIMALEKNYRCSKSIVEASCHLIRHNKKRFEKHPVAVREEGIPLRIVENENAVEESRWACQRLRGWMKEGVSPESIGVLYRNSHHVRCLRDTMREEGISFHTRDEMTSLYRHYICKDISAYFRLALGTGDREDMIRTANRPHRLISRESLAYGEGGFESVKEYYRDRQRMGERVREFQRHVEMMSGSPPYSAIQYLRKAVNYEKFIADYGNYRGVDWTADMEILEEIQERSRGFADMETWLEMTGRPDEPPDECREDGGIRLMTMHASKGLEFDRVLIIHACEGIIPSDKARSDEDIEEERRLFYVALTRAKTQVIISSVRNQYGKEKNVSRFWKEINEKGAGARHENNQRETLSHGNI